MAAESLNVRSMLSISEDMLTCKTKQEILAQVPGLEELIKALRLAHHSLVQASGQKSGAAARLRALDQELFALSAEHNAMTRGLLAGLQSVIELSPSSGESAPFEEVRGALFPEGLKITTASHREQGENAMRVQSSLTEGMRQTLRRVRIDGEGLHVHIERWVKIGAEINACVLERATLLSDEGATNVMTDELRLARQGW